MQHRKLFPLKLCHYSAIILFFQQISSEIELHDVLHALWFHFGTFKCIPSGAFRTFFILDILLQLFAVYFFHYESHFVRLSIFYTTYLSRTMKDSTGYEANIFQLKIWCTWIKHTPAHIIVHGQMSGCIVLRILRPKSSNIVDSF